MSTLTAPLVPAQCDLRDFAFMPLDVARLRDSDLASNETPEACWAAVLLWCAAWHQVPAGSIPDNDQWLAKVCGYLSRGRVDAAWEDVRLGVLRGWVKCSDGRLYHPVVAEKAREAWTAKLEQRWKTECARVKKYNQRHATKHVVPDFEEWLSLGCPQGQPLPVPRDKDDKSQGQSEEVPEDIERESPQCPLGSSIQETGIGTETGIIKNPVCVNAHDGSSLAATPQVREAGNTSDLPDSRYAPMLGDWQPDDHLLGTYLLQAGLPQPPPEHLKTVLVKFRLHYAGEQQPLSRWYSKLVEWIQRNPYANHQATPGAGASRASAGGREPRESLVERVARKNGLTTG